ncbi:Spy/CpxP family protein refolding chaperone [Thiohalorhabdus sp. Cl-TMA]|uniref:Spy/CpxP family protein refolding chaperone n=1 Tax=Thiohalorhabdus methylotrophus TaxID=3242694 RepID=A0ABV4TUP0_9GAMM
MNRIFRNLFVSLGTATAVSLAAPALANDYEHGELHGMMMGHGMMEGGMSDHGMDMMDHGMMMKGMSALGLDEGQVQEMANIYKEYAQQRAGMKVEMMQLRWQLYQEMQKDQPSPEEVGKIYEQIAQKKKTLLQGKVQTRNEMMGVLNQEQMQKLQEMKKRMHKMHMGGGKHGSKHGYKH